MDCNSCLPTFSSIYEDAQHVASEDFNLGVKTEIGESPNKLQHGESLFDITDPGAYFLVTVFGCCHFGAKTGEFFKVFSINHDRVIHFSVFTQNFDLRCIDFATNSVGCFAKTFSFLLDILVFIG